MSDEAFVTLSTNDNYCLGALVLGHSLRNVGTSRKLVILVTPSVSDDMRKCLSKVYDLVKEVDVMHSNEHKILEVMKRPELGVTLTKLHCWRLTQFKKCIFMDADTLPLKNIDELFEKEEISAVCDIGWPDCFNTGIFVFRPSETTFANLCKLASESGSFDGGDQGLLNTYFSDWSTSDISKHLSFIYNMSSVATYSYPAAYQRFGDTVKVVHFLGAMKPWMYGFNAMTRKIIPPPIGSQTQQLEHVQKWWDVFINQVQPNLTSDCAGKFNIFAQDLFGKSPPFEHAKHEENPLFKQETETCLMHENVDLNKQNDEDNENQGKSVNLDKSNDDNQEKDLEVTETIQNKDFKTRTNYDQGSFDLQNSYDDYGSSSIDNNLTIHTNITNVDDCNNMHDNSVQNESDLLEKESKRLKAWEKGSMDYLGLDRFDNIQKKLDQAIGLSHLTHMKTNEKQTINNTQSKYSKKSKLIKPCNSLDLSAGLASQLSKLRLDSSDNSHYPGVIGSSVHLDDYSRKRAWESGAIDYMGADSFENIQRKLDQAIGETTYYIPTGESFDLDQPSEETTPSTEQPTSQPSE